MQSSPIRSTGPLGVSTPAPAQNPMDIIDGLSDAVLVVDLGCRILQANRTARQWARQNAGDLIGRNCHEVFPCAEPCSQAERECAIPVVLTSGGPVKLTHVYRLPDTDQLRYVDVIASPLRDPAGEITAVIEAMRDVTQERQVAEALVRRNEHLSVLDTVARTVNQSLDLAEILDRALGEVLRLAGVDIGAIFLRDEIVGNLELLAYRGLSEPRARQVAQFGMLDGSCGGVIEYQHVVIVPELRFFHGRRAEALKQEGLSTLVHVPLIFKGCSLGSMCVGTHDTREFDLHEQELLTAIGNQIAATIENARLYAEVQRKEHLRGELLRKVISAQEEERKRIARELHDEISQDLTALIYATEEATELRQLAEVQSVLKNMRGVAQRTLDGVHKLIFNLRPSMLDHLGLVPALRWFARSRLESAGVRVVVHETCDQTSHADDFCRLPAETETALFRVVQEAITNIARHTMARNVRLDFDRADGTMTIQVEDDGIGFEPGDPLSGPRLRTRAGLDGHAGADRAAGGPTGHQLGAWPGQPDLHPCAGRCRHRSRACCASCTSREATRCLIRSERDI